MHETPPCNYPPTRGFKFGKNPSAPRQRYPPNKRSPSLTTCNSIHPSNGSESTGSLFCHRLKRRRSLLVAATLVATLLSATFWAGAALGLASSQTSGNLNSKLRSRAILVCSSGCAEDARTRSATPFSIFHSLSLRSCPEASTRRVRRGRG